MLLVKLLDVFIGSVAGMDGEKLFQGALVMDFTIAPEALYFHVHLVAVIDKFNLPALTYSMPQMKVGCQENAWHCAGF